LKKLVIFENNLEYCGFEAPPLKKVEICRRKSPPTPRSGPENTIQLQSYS